MYVSSFRICNFACYDRPEEVVFRPGINIITGKNNVGKSALLRALTLSFGRDPHRSLSKLPTPESALNLESTADFTISMSGAELREVLMFPGLEFHIPRLDEAMGVEDAVDQHLRMLFDQPELKFELRYVAGRGVITPYFPAYGAIGRSSNLGHDRPGYLVKIGSSGSATRPTSADAISDFDKMSSRVFSVLQSRQYSFSAQRFHVGRISFGSSSVLQHDAANLPEVLNTLQANTMRFERYNTTVRRVLDQVPHVSVAPAGTTELQIMVWLEDHRQMRLDLAIPLNECGTGVGQVLAILYVVLTSDSPRTIIIDEPQSFLHPGAIRKLIEVFREYSQHQYIIATHSPSVITSSNPSSITMITRQGVAAEFLSLNPRERDDLSNLLGEVGARLADVFGADDILWVEGPTEERCFPLIVERLIPDQPLMGTTIVGVKNTGDFEGDHAKDIAEVYYRLSQSSALNPPAIGFIFDRELRSEQQQNALRRRIGHLMDFLPRRLFENYLLHAEAIAAVVNGIDGFRDTPVDPDEVQTLIESGMREPRYFASTSQDLKELGQRWVVEIHGAQLLKSIFRELSETRCEYDKIQHGIELTRWLLDHDADQMEEIADLLRKRLGGRKTTASPTSQA